MSDSEPQIKRFPIKAECTKCGHSAEIFVSDARISEALTSYVSSRTMALWGPMMTKRMLISWLIVAAIGFLLGKL